MKWLHPTMGPRPDGYVEVDVTLESSGGEVDTVAPAHSSTNAHEVDHDYGDDVICVEHAENLADEPMEIWFEPQVSGEYQELALSYLQVSFFNGGYENIEVFVEHVGGRVACPAFAQDWLVSIESGITICPVFGEPEPDLAPSIEGWELCPCEVEGTPVIAGQIERVGLRFTLKPDDPWRPRFCMIKRSWLCFEDCPHERTFFEHFEYEER